MSKIVWDKDNNEQAQNWDGTEPRVVGNAICITELGCNCCPPGCGGCIDVDKWYDIGKSYYIWREI